MDVLRVTPLIGSAASARAWDLGREGCLRYLRPMFSGIVEGQRRLVQTLREGAALRLVVDLEDLAEGVSIGDSIALRGCCLTVDGLRGSEAAFHLMAETLGLTAFGRLAVGDRVNVERSLRLGDRLGGHFVSGHVDGLGRVTAVDARPEQTDLTLELPGHLAGQVIPKGSISIDGVSLTLAAIEGPRVTVCLIPHTLEVTTLGILKPGDPVHLEMDMIGKWVRQLMP